MARLPLKKKSAMDSLLESIDELAVAASEKMTTEEVRKVRKEINDLVDPGRCECLRSREGNLHGYHTA